MWIVAPNFRVHGTIACMLDMSGPVATSGDSTYVLSIEEAVAIYARAGHPRTPRSIQRYCASGHLDAIKETTTLGDKYFIDPESVDHHIAQIEELIALDTRTSGRDASRQDTSPVAPQFRAAITPTRSATELDTTRPVATSRDTSDGEVVAAQPHERYVEHLELQVDGLKEDRDFLRQQIKTKDDQIASLLERDRETNILVRGLQQMLSPLLGSPRHGRQDGDNIAPPNFR